MPIPRERLVIKQMPAPIELIKRAHAYVERMGIHINWPRCYIAGGFIRSFYDSTHTHDIDIFRIAPDYDFIMRQKEDSDPKLKWHLKWNLISATLGDQEIQMIHMVQGPPAKVICDFDFTICMAAVYLGQLYYVDRFFDDIENKRLIYIPNSMNPVSSIHRAQKYIDKGYSMELQDTYQLFSEIPEDNRKPLRSMGQPGDSFAPVARIVDEDTDSE